ncbi:DUF420 domain-containing protein [Bacillus horti]|uniref:Membrane protein n=1 Tax=Caldalkalibacillus horti TaxID=77523 RepID=A0ABT9W2L0_9BACI|nr:DUF420 domain-containing protein [Bacillus horti]MDQ0167487.1 putative membrane protein [Bacillus horti]
MSKNNPAQVKQTNAKPNEESHKAVQVKNYTPLIIALSIGINVLIAILFLLPSYDKLSHLDLSIMPMFNAIFNSFTFVFLLASYYFIMKKNIVLHKRFSMAAFITTALFLVNYVVYHFITDSTPFGGEGIVRGIYFFILISHILLAIAIVPLALLTVARGLNMQIPKHRKIARWTLPLWLYVSLTGVIIYLMISPYY